MDKIMKNKRLEPVTSLSLGGKTYQEQFRF